MARNFFGRQARGGSRPTSRRNKKLARGRNNLGRYVELGVERLEDRRMLAAGDLDTTFDVDGWVSGSFVAGDDVKINNMAIQNDGKIVVVGQYNNQQFIVARFNDNGTLDTTFGDNDGVGGHTRFQINALQSAANDIAIDSATGDIYVVGSAGSSFGIARLGIDGELDASFGTGGTVATPFASGALAVARGVALQSDGKIVVAGAENKTSGTLRDFAVARYNTNGTLDTTFDADGKLITDFNVRDDEAFDVTIQQVGSYEKIVVAGYARRASPSPLVNDFAIARYNPDGSLDTAIDGFDTAEFGVGGKRTTAIATSDNSAANAVAIDLAGQIVVVGSRNNGSSSFTDVLVARYTADGLLDTSFNPGGVGFGGAGSTIPGTLRINYSQLDFGSSILIQPDGKYVIGATVQTDDDGPIASYRFGLARINPTSGSLDTSFGSGGLVQAPAFNDGVGPISSQPETVRLTQVAMQPSGKIVAAGWVDFEPSPTDGDYLLARYESGLLIAEAGGPYAVNEPGGSVTLNGSGTGSGMTFEWDLDGDSIFGESGAGAANGDENGANPVFTVGGVDGPNDTFTVTLRVTDSTSFQAFDTATINILNVAPTLAISGAADVNEGSLYTLNLSSFDPGPDTITSWTINWGDATEIVAGNPTGVTHTYADGDANYVISATATDEDGTFAAGNTVALNVHNVAPTLAISGAADVNEGSSYTLNLSSADPGSDTITSWTINWGDGIEVVSGNPASVSHTYADGDTNYVISATATDEDGGPFAAGNTVAVIVHNVPPTLVISGAPDVDEGSSYLLNLSSSDPGSDAITSWTINWGDGIEVVSGNPASVSHTYADGDANYVISATATDEDGTFAAGNTVTVVVHNVAPTLVISGASDVDEGSSYSLNLSASDPGSDTISSWTINWGDGIEVVNGNPASVTHTYADGDANYVISATATDEDGTFAAGNTVAVMVDNVAPTLVISGASNVDEGSIYTLDLSSSDPGSDTISSWTINWGDGMEVVSGNPSSIAHTYADGDANYVITASATDEDGTFAAGNIVAVLVLNAAPALAISGASDVDEGLSYSLDLSSSDPGSDTITSWTINWGDGIEVVSGNPASVSHTYADGDANYVISATATDEDGTFAAGNTVAATVHNVAPILAISGATDVNEGSNYTLNLSSSDPGSDTITNWTINWGDGIEVVSGNPASVTHTYADGNANYVISATATDEDGTFAADNTVAVMVHNVAPTLAISGASDVDEGSGYILNLSSSDPGSDTITSWTINWGDGIEVVSGNPATVSHTYADGDASYVISATASDEDGAFAAGNTAAVMVHNVDPTANAGGPYFTFDDTPITLNGSGFDVAGAADPLTYAWDLDNNGTFETAGQNAVFDPQALGYTGTQTRTVKLLVTDGDGGQAIATTTVELLGVGTAVIGGVLHVVGSDANDIVLITRVNNNIKVIASFNSNNPVVVSESSVTEIQVRVRGGHDIVVTTPNVTKLMTIDGGNGNDLLTGGGGRNVIVGGAGHDILHGDGGDDVLLGGTGNDDLFGGSGNDVLVGGDGNDILTGGTGRDVLIGSQNEDLLVGGNDEDILIGGYTIHDGNVAALDAIMAIWGSSASFNARVATLTTSGGLLQAGATVFDDDDCDLIVGGAGRDLVFGDTNPWDGAIDLIALHPLQDVLVAVN